MSDVGSEIVNCAMEAFDHHRIPCGEHKSSSGLRYSCWVVGDQLSDFVA
jgi:hypothetical protein